MSGSVVCTHCGHRNPLEARFCSSCGTSLAGAADQTVTLPKIDPLQDAVGTHDDTIVSFADLEPGTRLLVVRSAPQEGDRFILGSVTRLGRHPDSEIMLDDITVSRRHAEIRLDGAGAVVRDAGSLNGTYLNGSRIDESPLRNGDELQVGKFHLVYFVVAATT